MKRHCGKHPAGGSVPLTDDFTSPHHTDAESYEKNFTTCQPNHNKQKQQRIIAIGKPK